MVDLETEMNVANDPGVGVTVMFLFHVPIPLPS